MEVNEDYPLTKATQHYACKPLVEEIQRLRTENEVFKNALLKINSMSSMSYHSLESAKNNGKSRA